MVANSGRSIDADLVCTINKRGRLLEQGKDPITRVRESRNAYAQTQGSGNTWRTIFDEAASEKSLSDKVATELQKAGLKKNASPAAQVLRLIVGLLGEEVHEKPTSGAESWLTFRDESVKKLGLSGEDTSSQEQALIAERNKQFEDDSNRWQLTLLRNLRGRVAQRRGNVIGETDSRLGQDDKRHAITSSMSVHSLSTEDCRARVSVSAGLDVDGTHNKSVGSLIGPNNALQKHFDGRPDASAVRDLGPIFDASFQKSSDKGETSATLGTTLANTSQSQKKRMTASGEGDMLRRGDCETSEDGVQFNDHMDLAEFVLGRISHAVNVLQNPNKQDRPMLLRDYTEEMLVEVAADLRQWLEQLATLLSLYHVNLLDLEGERTALQDELQRKEMLFSKNQEEHKHAVLKHDRMQELWQEAKLKARAKEQLGIAAKADDKKIYSQAEVDAMLEEWTKEHVEPLTSEISDLRRKRDDILDRLAEKDKKIRELQKNQKPIDAEVPEAGMSKAAQQLLTASLNGVAERVSDDALMGVILRMVESVPRGCEDLQDVIADIKKIPLPSEKIDAQQPKFQTSDVSTVALDPNNPIVRCLATLGIELESLEQGLRNCAVGAGADKLGFFTTWCKNMVNLVRSSVCNEDWSSEIQYGENYLEAIQHFLGRQPEPSDKLKTAQNEECTLEDLKALEETDRQSKFPIKMKQDWTSDIPYSTNYTESVQKALGRLPKPSDKLKTAQNEELTFEDLKAFEEIDRQRKFPIKMKKDEPEARTFTPPPKWDLGALAKVGKAIRTIGINTEFFYDADTSKVEEKVRTQVEEEWQTRILHLRKEMEEDIVVSKRAAEDARAASEDALKRLEEETANADITLADLRRKLHKMQQILDKKGLGRQAAEALEAAGLSSFLDAWKDRNVFERLYQDALDRMRRNSQIQEAIYNRSSEHFIRALTEIVDPSSHLEAGFDNLNHDNMRLNSVGMGIGSVGKVCQSMPEARRPKAKNPDGVHGGSLEKPNLLSPENVFQLLESQPIAAPKITEGVERPEGGFKGRLRIGSPRPYGETDYSGLSIGSYSPGNAPTRSAMARSQSLPVGCCHSGLGGSSPSRPVARPLGARVPGGLAEGESLPRLECRGQGKISETEQYNPMIDSSPSAKNRHRSVSSMSTAVGAGTPFRTTDAWRSTKDSLGGTMLTIGSLASNYVANLPPEPNGLDVNQPNGYPPNRGDLVKLQARNAQLGRSEQQFVSRGGVPRFLVQSVQGAY